MRTSNTSSRVCHLFNLYNSIKDKIESRLGEFEEIWEKGDDKRLFEELVFCLLTPQTKALDCARAVNLLKEKNLLFYGREEAISKTINFIRFKNHKADYIVRARELFFKDGKGSLGNFLNSFEDEKKLREELVKKIKGLGLKEASHFLRNIGRSENLIIIDRHILKCALRYKIIRKIPKNISKKNYLEMEKKILKFSRKYNIPPNHLDFLFWYDSNGYFFK
ncbi:MAG: N-glycosylase/DNA lyase [Thermoanaerobaculia bacterium]